MALTKCKNCGCSMVSRNGNVRGKQRYKCKECGFNFVAGDERTDEKTAALKALVIMLYSIGKCSYGMLGKIFGRNRSLIYRWIREAGLACEPVAVGGEVREIEFDEMWHFIQSKKTSFGSSRPLIAARGKLSHGYSVVVMLQRSGDCTTR